MPFTETWPQLWIVNDMDYDRATQLISEEAGDESPGQSWRSARQWFWGGWSYWQLSCC
jgi:hypothetical protein